MEEALVKAIESLANKATKTEIACEALQFTQAALNAAHTLITLRNMQ